MKTLLKIATLILLSMPALSAEIPKSFETARKHLFKDVYNGTEETTIYCGCKFNPKNKHQAFGCADVTTFTKGETTYPNIVQAEHLVSANTLASNLQCYNTTSNSCIDSKGRALSGRACCLKINPAFREAHNDLVNLVPVNQYINRFRGTRTLGGVLGESRKYGSCDLELSATTLEPRPEVRGDIARAILYMYTKYGQELRLSSIPGYFKQYYQWIVDDPVSLKEIEYQRRICNTQGSSNPLVYTCKVE